MARAVRGGGSNHQIMEFGRWGPAVVRHCVRVAWALEPSVVMTPPGGGERHHNTQPDLECNAKRDCMGRSLRCRWLLKQTVVLGPT